MIKDVLEYLNNEVANIYVDCFHESDVEVKDGDLIICFKYSFQVRIDLEDGYFVVLPLSDNFNQEEIEALYDIMTNKEYIIELLNEEEEDED